MTNETALAEASRKIERAEAELLLAHVSGVDRTNLLAKPGEKLTLLRGWRFQRLVNRRARGWPTAYLVGEQWFYGRRFEVNRRVLIPRPETETLIDLALQMFRRSGIRTIIDVGTGSGCIAVTLAAELGVPVVAIDVSRAALGLARQNARRHGVEKLITFCHGSLLDAVGRDVAAQRPYGNAMVIANLPYLPADHPASQTPYEPTNALYGGGQDGLDSIRALVEQCRDEPQRVPTAIILEIDPRQAAAVASTLVDRLPSGTVTVHDDLAGRARVATWIKRDT